MGSSLFLLAAAAPQSPDSQLLDIDGTLFVQLGLFFVTLYVLGRWLFRPYMRVRAERVARTDGYRAEAEHLEAEAAARLAEIEADLLEARRVGSDLRAETRAEAHEHEEATLAAAQADAQTMVAGAKAEVDKVLAAERRGLPARAADIGRLACEKILGRTVSS